MADLEALPWPEDRFDVVTGVSSFQFADDKVRALTEARRVSRGLVAAVVPSRVPEAGITVVFQAVVSLFPPDVLEAMKHSGMFALSAPGKLDEVMAAAGLRTRDDDELECPIVFEEVDAALRAFLVAGPMAIAITHSGESVVEQAVREALVPFTGSSGRVTLPAWYRAIIATA